MQEINATKELQSYAQGKDFMAIIRETIKWEADAKNTFSAEDFKREEDFIIEKGSGNS